MIRYAVLGLAVTFLLPAVASAEYPVLFVHGWCSDSSTWNTMFENLPRHRFGEELIRYYQDTDGGVSLKQSPTSAERRSFTIDFYDRANGTFDAASVANVSINAKGEQLKAVIDQIKRDTGSPKVIIVSHSMGGLVSRTYVQGIAVRSSGPGTIPYDDDVAGLLTIGTPHQGSDRARLNTELLPNSGCRLRETINKREMEPESTFFDILNNPARRWPDQARLDAIASYYTSGLFEDSDAVVTRQSQDIRTVSERWARHPRVQAHLQTFGPYRLGDGTHVLHSTVLDSRITASRTQTIVEELDGEDVSPPIEPTINLSGTWSGRWSSTDGQGRIVLRLTQTGLNVAGAVELFANSGAIGGRFSGTLTQASPTNMSLSWVISYSPGMSCQGSFGGPATATSTTIQGNYTGSDCQHTFSNGALSLALSSPASSLPNPAESVRRYTASASSLYLSSISATGTDTLIGAFRTASGTTVSVTDIAVTPDGRAYALSFTTLYSVNVSTGTLTPIGTRLLSSINALASDAAGNLWGASVSDGSLYRINRGDASTTFVGRFGSGWVSSGDLAFDANGTLWATVRRSGDSSDTLVTVNTSTGVATSRGVNMPQQLFGLTFVDGHLYGLSSVTDSLYSIDTNRGTAAFVRRLSFAAVGALRVR